jgi:hypothetical protein
LKILDESGVNEEGAGVAGAEGGDDDDDERSCYALCYIFVPHIDLSQLLTLSVRLDRLTAVYRTHFGRCRYLNT